MEKIFAFTRRHSAIFVLALVWLVVLIVPSLRELNARQFAELNGPSEISHEEFARLAGRHPNDPRVLVAAVETAKKVPIPEQPGSYIRDPRLHWRGYDPLIASFKGSSYEAWLLTKRLRAMCSMNFDNRRAGALEKAPRPWATLTKQEASEGLALAQRGQQVEPQNTFFDWMAASFNFALFRDAEAARVLAAASRKTHYDSHVRDDLKASIYTRNLIQPQLPEEEVVASAELLLPHLSKHVHSARLLAWQAVLSQRRGDHQRAIKLGHAIARLGAVMIRDSSYIVEGHVGQAIMRTGWWNEKTCAPRALSEFNRSHGKDKDRLAELSSLAEKFAAYAATQGRRDIAAETRTQVVEAVQFRRQAENYIEHAPIFNQDSANSIRRVMALWAVSHWLVQLALILASLWIVFSLLSWRFRWPTSTRKASRGGTASVSLFLFFIGAGLLLAALKIGIELNTRNNFLFSLLRSPEGSSASQDPYGFALYLRPMFVWGLPMLTLLLHVVAQVWRNRKELGARDERARNSDEKISARQEDATQSTFLSKPSRVALMTVAILVSFLALIMLPPSGNNIVMWFLCWTFSLLAAHLLEKSRLAPNASRARTIARQATVGALIGWPLLLTLFGNFTEVGFNFWHSIEASLWLLIFGAIVFVLARWIASSAATLPRFVRRIAPDFFPETRATLRAMTLLASVLYITSLAASFAARREVGHYINGMINEGETSMMRRFAAQSSDASARK